jgi:acyl-CoA synthetase (AMP-forming)/AMP-acid ligase II
MTEMSPIGTLAMMKAGMDELPRPEKIKIKLKQGRPMFTVEMKITDDDDKELPRDGKAFGRLKVRGPAAVIGIVHPKWDERPLLIIVKKQGQSVSREEILKHLEGKIAKWWMPDDVAFVDEIPHTATGKIQKITLRERFKDYRFPATVAAAR